MTVLMFGWEFPPHITGGLGTACYGLTRALSRLGCDIIFVVPKSFGDENSDVARVVGANTVRVSNAEDMSHCFTYVEVDSKLIPYQTEQEYFYFENQTRIASSVSCQNGCFSFTGGYVANLYAEVDRYAVVAKTIAKNYSFDVIHCHDWLTYPAGVVVHRISGKPLVVHIHATEYDRSKTVNTKVYDIEKWGMDEADKIICVSELTKSILVKHYGQPADKIVVVHNGLERKGVLKRHYSPIADVKIVTFLGRITYQKGPEYFVEAAHKVLERDSNVHFVMAGSGDLQRKMVEKVCQLGIADKFHFTGFLNAEQVDKMLSISDVYVMPSVSEPFGISSLEALDAGVPIIISNQSGAGEVVESALKVDFWDVDAMADAINALLHYKPLSKMLINRSDGDLKHLTWDEAASKVLTTYRQMLDVKA